MLLLSARACSETTKWNSVCLEISFDRSLSLIETSQLICVANWLTAFFVMLGVRGFHLISGWTLFCWVHGLCRFLVELPWICRDCAFFNFFYFDCLFIYLYFSTEIFSPGSWVRFLYFAQYNLQTYYSIVLLCCLWTCSYSLKFI